MRAGPRLLPAFLALLAMAAVPLPRVPGAETPAAGEAGSLRFLRVYAPVDQLQNWPLDKGHYPPIDRDEFERLVKATGAEARLGRASVAATITAAQYQARLIGEELRQGEAALEVTHAAEGPVMLPLDACQMPMSQATWAGEPRRPAELGLAVDGKQQVLVERSGRLEFGWSLRGRRDAAGAVAFAPEFPACPVNRLILELPPQTAPAVDRGIVTREGAGQGGTTAWRIDTGGHHRFELRVVPTDEANRRRQMPVVRQSLVYDFSLHGVEVSAQWKLDVPGEPLRQLALTLDSELQLVSARYGDSPLGWSLVSAGAKGSGTRVVLELPEPIRGMDRSLRLAAMAPLKIGQRWTLPRIRPEGMFWQEGNATLLVSAPLLVEQLVPRRARQTKTAPLAAPRSGESLELQCFAPDATAEVLLGQAQAPLQVDSGTALEFRRGEIAGKVVAAFRVSGGERFLLEAGLARPWIVDSVESVPSEALDDWIVERRGSQSALKIRLAKAVSPSRPLRLLLSVRRLGVQSGQPLRVEDLTPLRFQTAPDGQRLLAIHAAEPCRLKLTGAERLKRLKPQDLPAAQRELFVETPRDVLFEIDAAAAPLEVAWETQKPSYSAAIRVEASARDGLLSESYWLECVPGGAPVDRLLVHLSSRRSTPLRWSLGTGEDDQLVARLLPARAKVATAGQGGETWEVALRRPRNLRFEIRASRVSPLAGRQPLSLASLPEAASQRATLVLRSVGSTAVRVESSRLQPMVPEPVPDNQYQTALATYSYDPARDLEAASEAAATIFALPDPNGPPAVWVWDCQLESRYETDGSGRHLAVYRLQSTRAAALELALPPTTSLPQVQGIWVDDAQSAWRPVGEEGQRRLAIDLPAGEQFPVVSVHFTTLGRRFRIVDRLAPPLPGPDAPILAGHWTVWLPPGLEAVDADSRWQSVRVPEPTWSQRLFGPVGRPVKKRAFDPFRASSWSGMVLADPARQSAERRATVLLREIGQQAARSQATRQPKALDWGALLTDKAVEQVLTDAPNEMAPVALLIDRRGLSRMGLGPRTPLEAPPPETPAARGAALLQRAGLALLVHPEALVLTSAADAALLRGKCLAPMESEATWSVNPGPLAEQVQTALGETGDAALVPVAAWEKTPADPPSPWRGWQLADSGSLESLAWTAHRLEMAGELAPGLSVVRGDTVRTFRWAAFLAVVAFGWWKWNTRPAAWLVLLGLAASAALLLPEGYAPVASGVFLGILASLGLRLSVRRKPPVHAGADSPAATRHAALAGAAPTIGVLLMTAATAVLLCGSVGGAEPSAEHRPAKEAVPRVFIPVDDKQQPVGDKVYVPEGLYGDLQRRAARWTEQPHGWLLTGGTYRGALSWQGTPERLVLSELKAAFDLHVFGRAARIRLPFVRDKTNLLPDGLLLDGRPVSPEWQEETGQLCLTVPEPGQFRLELSLQAAEQRSGPSSGFELRIPRLASSRVELAVPADAPAIEVPSAVGSVTRVGDPPRLTADLGPGDRLTVRWPEGARRGAVGPAVDVEELLWLKVQPGSVILDTRLKFKIVQGRVSQFQLLADPRLRLLPSPRSDSPVAQVHTTPGQAQTLRVDLSRAVSEQMVLDMTFLLTGTSGVGNLRLPSLALPDARITKRWMAVSVDPGLEHEQQGSGRLEPVAVPDFAGAWGPAANPPLFAYSLSSGEPAWSMSTRPREPRTASDQVLALSLGEKEARVLLDAHLTTTAGANFQYRLSAPTALIVDGVSVREAATERAARWSRDRDGSVVVFLTGPATGKHDLSLRGRLPISSREPFTLTVPRLEGAEARSCVVQLFREPAVEVTVEAVTGLAETDVPSIEEGKLPLGRLMKCWSVSEAAPGSTAERKGPSLQLRCRPNRPKVRFEQITSLRSSGDDWEAQVDLRVNASDGVVDELLLDVPPEWPGPYKVAPPAAAKAVGPVPRQGRRPLVIRPRAAIESEFRVTISGPLAVPAGQRPAAPDILLQGAQPTKRLLVLPTQSQLQPITWETRGLQATPLPKDFPVVPRAREALVAYQVQEEPFRAVLSTEEGPSGVPQVYLADISLAWQADGTCRGAAVFDLGPVERSQCTVRLPPGYRLVQVTSAASPAPPIPAGEGQWQVSLNPTGLPQRIEVLFSGSLRDRPGVGSIEFDAPTLEGLPVRQTLWTVSGPPSYDPERTADLQPSDRLQHELTRLQSATALIEQGADLPVKDPESMLRWYRLMADRWAALHHQVERLLPTARGDAAQNAKTEFQAIVRKQWRIAERLGGSQILSQELAETPVVRAACQLWLSTLDRPEAVSRSIASGGAASITLSYRQAEAPRLSTALWAAAGLWAVIALAALVMRVDAIRTIFAYRPHLAVLLVGLGWWAWLEPSPLGFATAAVCLVGVLGSLRKRRKE